MKQILKIFFIHPVVHDIQSFLSYTHLCGVAFDKKLVWDVCNPEVLFATEQIYCNAKALNVFKTLYNRAKILVYYGSEASCTDFNIFDYGIGFDNTIQSFRYSRLPSPDVFFDAFIFQKSNEIMTLEEAHRLLNANSGFCNFIYSNSCAHSYRDQLFFKLSEYKKVDSMGKHLNNTKRGATGFSNHYHDCVELKKGYKFSIASENACFHGYTTEKILTSLQAHNVPIYWGNPDIELDVNPNCFINCSNFSSLDSVLQRVKEIDEDDDLWSYMVSQPWYTKNQEKEQKKRKENYYTFMFELLSKSTNELSVKPNGTFVDLKYRKWFQSRKIANPYVNLIHLKVKSLFFKKNDSII